ncbi:hypothetical protein FBZ91_103321 [Nitrospirillum viridazoti]|nr:hypothetical protein FBZ91_103321 [Nitrospirillum amazonense]
MEAAFLRFSVPARVYLPVNTQSGRTQWQV